MRNLRFAGSLLLVAVSGCSILHVGGKSAPNDPVVIAANQRLQALRANSDLASRVPDAITEAQKAIDAAANPHGDSAHAAHLAFIADTRVKVAETMAKASRNEEEYKALSAKLAARQGGSSVANLAPLMPAQQLGPPTSAGAMAEGGRAAGGSSSAPLAPSEDFGLPPPTGPGGSSWGSLGVELPAPGDSAGGAAGPPPLPPLPLAAGAPRGPGEAGVLLWLPGTEFTSEHQLSGYGRQAVHALLASLSRTPTRSLGIFSATNANIDAVRRELVALGIPEKRMRSAPANDVSGVEVDWQ